MVLRVPSNLPFHWMGVVESNEPFANRTVQRQRIVDAVRLLGRHRYPRHHEFDPVVSRRIDNEDLPIEIQKHIEGRIMRLIHRRRLSHTDNPMQ